MQFMGGLTIPTVFFGVCIPLRFGLAALARYGRPPIRFAMAVGALLVAVCLMALFLADMDPLVLDLPGKSSWRNDLRPLHSVLYWAFAVEALRGNESAWKLLFLDASMGALVGLAPTPKKMNRIK